jgi:pseudaminic acid synthase
MTKMNIVTIDGKKIGAGNKPYIICELSGNHNGSLDRALSLVDAAARTGCDAIKIQSYTPETMTINSDKPDFQISSGTWEGYNLYELYEEAHTPFEWHEALFERAASNNITMFSTPFDTSAADLLDDIGVPAFKIASFEIGDLELISHVASKQKPMIISTGMASLSEIEVAVNTARAAGCNELILLHCVSSYPAPNDQSNIKTIKHLSKTFDLVTGLSDHTHGTATSVAAVALGASVIEKHFTLRRSDGGPDAAFSLEPDEFKRLCADCSDAWTSIGKVSYERQPAENSNLVFRRSIYAIKDIVAGELFTRENIKVIRPGFGLPPSEMRNILGTTAKRNISIGTALSRSDL